MSDYTNWTDAERHEQVWLKSELSSIDTNKKWCLVGSIVGLIVTGASPILGLVIMAGGYVAFLYHQKQAAVFHERHRNLLIKKNLDPRNYGYDENGKYRN